MENDSAFDTREGLVRVLRRYRSWLVRLEDEILANPAKSSYAWHPTIDEMAQILARTADRLRDREEAARRQNS